MSIISKTSHFKEEMVVLSSMEGDDLLRLSRCGITDFDSNYRIKRSCSRIWVFEYICRGSGYLNIDGREYTPKEGDAYIISLGSDHEYGSDPRNPWRKIWFNFSGVLVSSLLKHYAVDNIDHIPNCPELESVFKECLDEMQKNPDNAHYHSTLVLHKIIYHISQVVHGKRFVIDDTAKELKSRIDNAALQGKTLSEMISDIGLSESQLIRKFKNTYGCTPYAYLMDCRLNTAKSLLLNTSAKISEVSERTGFSNPYYFSAIFKKKFGVSPSNYRSSKR